MKSSPSNRGPGDSDRSSTIDTRLFLDINSFAVDTSWLHGVMRVIAEDGVGVCAVLVLAAWALSRHLPNAEHGVAASLWTAVVTPMAVLLNHPFASVFHRERPYRQLHGVQVLIARNHDFSFPSDHSVAVGAAAAGLWVVAHYGGRSLRYVAIAGSALAGLVAASRVYVGVHYPSDVLVGLIFGAVVALAGWWLVRSLLIRGTTAIGRRGALRPLVRAAGNGSREARPAG